MINQQLTERQIQILTKIFKEDDPAKWIVSIQNQVLNFDQIERACDLISTEFHMNGIDENFEATDYGREIENLLDVVNQPRLK